MTISIKICGLSTEETIDAATAAGADMVGLVFHDASPRHLGLNRASELAQRVRGRAEIVALTVEADDATLDAIVTAIAPAWLQLHGTESPDRVAAIAGRYGLPVLKAIPVREVSDVAIADRYRGVADMILFDAKPPAGTLLPGGNGISFDWTLLEGGASPFMLSGGLDPANVGEAIRVAAPAAVDVSSGVETAPGRKDADLIRAFVAAARMAASEPAEAAS